MPSRKSFKHFLQVSGLYLLLTVVLTFPLVLQLNSSVFGFTSDNFSTIWYFGALKDAGLDLSQNITTSIRYPLGVNLADLPPEMAWALPFLLLTYLTNSLMAFNLITILGFVFSGVSMYYLIFYLTKDKLISLFAGFVFSFAPYHFWQGFVHINLGLLYTLPLYTLALLYFDKNRTLRSGLFLGLSFLFAFFTSLYYGLFLVFLTFGFVLGQVLTSLLKRKNYFSWAYFKSGLVATTVLLVVTSPLLFRVFFQKSGFGTVGSLASRPLNDLLSLSMRPWDFLLPAPNHPFLGEMSNNLLGWIRAQSVDFKTSSAFLPERIAFLGITTVVVFLISLWFVFRKKKYQHLTLVLLISLGLILLISAPPFIILKGIKIDFPSTWIYPLLPFFRVYARLGIMVHLLVLIISSFGLATVLKSGLKKKVVLGLLSALIFLEFLPFGWGQTTTLANQPVYDWVKNTPQGTVIAEYPIAFDTANSLIWQRYHQKNLYNGLFQNEVIPLKEISDLSSPQTWLKLKASGVDYVVFHTQYLYDKSHPINDFYYKEYGDPPLGEGQSWAKEVASFANATVYQPTTKAGKVVYLDGQKPTYTWLYEEVWSWSEEDNVVFVYNSSGKEVSAKLSYQVSLGGIRDALWNGTRVKSGDMVLVKPGQNEVVFTNDRPRSEVKIDTFNLAPHE